MALFRLPVCTEDSVCFHKGIWLTYMADISPETAKEISSAIWKFLM